PSTTRTYPFILLTPRPPRPPLFPYTTLFRSARARLGRGAYGGTPLHACHPPVAVRQRHRAHVDHAARGLWHVSTRACHAGGRTRSEEHTSELQSLAYLVCRLLLEKKKNNITH